MASIEEMDRDEKRMNLRAGHVETAHPHSIQSSKGQGTHTSLGQVDQSRAY
jgi:hypothetical protein